MDNSWYDRFLRAVEIDGRSRRAISLAANCGPNFLHEMIKYGKRPTIDKLMLVLDALEGANAMYVLTGMETTAEDGELFHLLAQSSEDEKQAFLAILRSLRNNK